MLNKAFPLIGFIACAYLFWPGLIRPDSITQLQQALVWSFNDSHPPMFGITLWFFGKIYNGYGLTLLFNLALYWSAISLYAKTEKTRPWLYSLIAIFPPILAYQMLVIKDLAFVNSYIFMCAWLHFYSSKSIRPSKLSLLLWLAIAFYGTACAYQAVIALPGLCFWLSRIYLPHNRNKWISLGTIIFICITGAIFLFNKQLIRTSERGQMLKLYDLAGISIKLNQPIFPDYLKENPRFDFKRIKNLYSPRRVDDLLFCQDTPLPPAINYAQSKALQKYWIKSIVNHPIAYLKHRYDIFYQQLTLSLLKNPDEIKGEIHERIIKVMNLFKDSWIFAIAKLLMSCILYVILQIFLILKSMKDFQKHKTYADIFFQNMSGISLTISLFFIANAAEARYAYLTIVTCCFSLPMLINIKKDLCNR